MLDWGAPCAAPAKLNLFLHVTGRRADGYHTLQTVFRLIDHSDTLYFLPREDGRIERTDPLPGVPAEHDLCVRAARLLQEHAGVRHGVTLRLEKRLPMGGGLGGGSSDAATTLLALNHLWQAGLSRAQLQALALRLGADVPLFVFGRNAYAEGVGEALTALDPGPRWYVVIEPGVSVSTAAVFADPQLTRDTKPLRIAGLSAGCDPPFGRNDLQSVVVLRYPEVAAALAWLEQYGAARMTGSGACVFAPCDSAEQARGIAALAPPCWRAWAAQGLARHPLWSLAE